MIKSGPFKLNLRAREVLKNGVKIELTQIEYGLLKAVSYTHLMCIRDRSKAPAEIYGLTDRAVQAGNFARLVLLDWDTEKASFREPSTLSGTVEHPEKSP